MEKVRGEKNEGTTECGVASVVAGGLRSPDGSSGPQGRLFVKH